MRFLLGAQDCGSSEFAALDVNNAAPHLVSDGHSAIELQVQSVLDPKTG